MVELKVNPTKNNKYCLCQVGLNLLSIRLRIIIECNINNKNPGTILFSVFIYVGTEYRKTVEYWMRKVREEAKRWGKRKDMEG